VTIESDPTPAALQTRGRILELDGLRALAAGSVLVHHFAGLWVAGFPIGSVGLRIFFVLSGFLITGILLGLRDGIETRGDSTARRILQFYVRRMIRLMPVLYVAVAVLVALNLGVSRKSWPWDLAYLSNFYAIRIGNLVPAVGHFWTLAVEEQFYLVWPWIILLAPRRWLGKIIIAIIAAAPIFRIVGWLRGWHWTVIYCLPIGAWDALGLGALLLICEREKISWRKPVRNFRIAALWIATPLAALGLCLSPLTLPGIRHNPTWSWAALPVQFYRQAVTDTMLALFGFAVLGWLREKPDGMLARSLRRRPLVYLGTISYGTYVYHVPLKAFYDRYIARNFPAMPADGSISYFLLLTALTLVLAAISWHGMEKPISRLKKFVGGGNRSGWQNSANQPGGVPFHRAAAL
jgi:peptidoglycan/LPS O-acetylase OafA/YrhL